MLFEEGEGREEDGIIMRRCGGEGGKDGKLHDGNLALIMGKRGGIGKDSHLVAAYYLQGARSKVLELIRAGAWHSWH